MLWVSYVCQFCNDDRWLGCLCQPNYTVWCHHLSSAWSSSAPMLLAAFQSSKAKDTSVLLILCLFFILFFIEFWFFILYFYGKKFVLPFCISSAMKWCWFDFDFVFTLNWGPVYCQCGLMALPQSSMGKLSMLTEGHRSPTEFDLDFAVATVIVHPFLSLSDFLFCFLSVSEEGIKNTSLMQFHGFFPCQHKSKTKLVSVLLPSGLSMMYLN